MINDVERFREFKKDNNNTLSSVKQAEDIVLCTLHVR